MSSTPRQPWWENGSFCEARSTCIALSSGNLLAISQKINSDPHKDLAPIHPEQNQPERQQHEDAGDEALALGTGFTKEFFREQRKDIRRVRMRVGSNRLHNESAEVGVADAQVGHAVGDDGVHADDAQRKGPRLP